MEKILNRERLFPIKKLAALWLNDFVQNEKTYINTLIPMIIAGDFSKITSKEREIIFEIKENLSKNEWKNFKILFLGIINALKTEIYNKEILKKAENYLSNDNFIEFGNLYKENKNLLKNLEDTCITNLKTYTHKIKTNIIKLSSKNFKEALSYFYKTANTLPENEKEVMGLFLEDVEDLINILSQHKFVEADTLFFKKKIITKEHYENLKKDYVLQYFNYENIDEQKALAISSIHPNVLLKARAGSGKTSTICLKTLFLIEKYNINPDEILLLAFNKEAKVKIRKDLFEKYGLKNYINNKNSTGFENAKTFHSFAKSICPDNKIIEDKKRKEFIIKAINNVLEKKNFKKEFYKFYKTSLEIPIKKEISISDDSKIKFIKDLSQITLQGEIVKSHGEKYIADFLFEHGIDYQYEKIIIFSKNEKEALNIDDDWNIYRPDFYIKQAEKEFYLEHWGVDEKALEPDCFNKKGVISDVSKYIKNMHIKRRYFRKKDIPLIETWAKDSQVRKNFEQTLYETLKKFNINLEKQDEETLFNKVKELNIKSFYKTIENFISTIKKSKFDNFYIERKLEDKNLSERTKIFLKLGYEAFLEYQKLLKEEGLSDFDDLIICASKKILTSKGECEFKILGDDKLKIKKLKYILIDEYQDFSKLFFDLILAIKCFNPKVQIFATGDDFQAINGFAGSDLNYFTNFKKLFNNSEIYNLTNNYRSYKNIINTSNTLMTAGGFGGALSNPIKNEDGEILKINVDKTFINKENQSDLIYSFKNDSGKIKAKYLKTIHRLIRLNPDKNFLILSRLNKILGSNLEFAFSKKLSKMKTVDKNKVKIMTIHKSKGLEADIVIILRTINGIIPFIHPDFEIMTALNKNYTEILDEEKRLFYVALTRAKERVYILTESKLESVYLKDLNLKEITFRDLNFENSNFLLQ